MNPLFSRKYKYKLGESLDEVRAELKHLLNDRKFDFSVNIFGRLKDNDSFTLQQKAVFGIYALGYWSLAIAEGKLNSEGERCVIKVTYKAGYWPIGVLYVILFLIILRLVAGNNFILAGDGILIALFIGFSLLCIVINLSLKKLKRQFEKVFGIRDLSKRN